jgi:PKD repeat protein
MAAAALAEQVLHALIFAGGLIKEMSSFFLLGHFWAGDRIYSAGPLHQHPSAYRLIREETTMKHVQFRWPRWLRRAFASNGRRCPHTFRPEVSVLEDRTLLSTSLYGASPLACYRGVGFQENVVAGLDGVYNGQQDLNASDYQVQINWGDGSQWMAADLAPNDSNSSVPFLVKGSHTYASLGTYDVVVYAQGPDGSSTSAWTTTVSVSAMPSGIPGVPPNPTVNALSPSDVQVHIADASPIRCYAGVGFQENVVAALQIVLNGQPDMQASDYQPQINWGDSNQWDAADLAANSNPSAPYPFLVKGSHIYAKPGTYDVVIYAQGPDGTSVSAWTTTVSVSAMPSGIPGIPPNPTINALPPSDVQVDIADASPISCYAGVGFQENVVAALEIVLNGQLDVQASDYQPQINWGDSNQWDAADLAANSNPSAPYLRTDS